MGIPAEVVGSINAGSGSRYRSKGHIPDIAGSADGKPEKQGSCPGLWVQSEGYTQDPYCFNELIESVQKAHVTHYALTPPVPQTRKKKKATVTQFKLNSKQFTEDSLNWSRVCDLKKLVQLRCDMGDGLREPMAFYLCNHYALRYSRDLALRPTEEWYEFRSLCKTAAPDWTEQKIREKTSNLYQLTKDDADGKTIEFMGKDYRPLYTPKNEYLIDLFGITPEEQRQMITIISDEEYARREGIRKGTDKYKEEQKVRDRRYREEKRREAGARPQDEYLTEVKEQVDEKREQAIKLHKQGMSTRAIAKEMGCGKSTISRYLNSGKSVPPLVERLTGTA